MVKLPCQDMFSVPVTVTPLASQPGQPAYPNRGIFNSGEMDVQMLDGSVFSDQQTILDIRDAEYWVVPMQGDRVNIPLDCNGEPQGDFEITDTFKDGGGQTTCKLRKYDAPAIISNQPIDEST
jgi:hypothetical protein